ncbi:hypothetical protein I532_04115 [Brevibacillus borstelensis AK1]|uniref:Uncharacterized protein n=1 Tax=Brevibacillus borstelensis AK1 TaxID=1300222 RepID=M8E676_9BACL|nr:hypothetical protein [Brevibacillus borstelensis]EMT54761.1 hypothetical protein I532_04115 [Brevibacillus borstelensis AK1]
MNEKLRITPKAQADVAALVGIELNRAHSWINERIRKSVQVTETTYQYGDYLFLTEHTGYRVKVTGVTRQENDIKRSADVVINGITIKEHAIDRAVQRFRIPREQAAQWIYERFLESEVVAENIRSYTNEGHTYAARGVAIGVGTDRKTIRTVYYNTKRFPPVVSDKVRDVVAKEIRKLDRRINAIKRALPLQKAALEFERAERKLALMSTRSVAKRMALQARINALDTYINEIDEELAQLIEKKKRVANAYIAI